jgi:hypothetical protein
MAGGSARWLRVWHAAAVAGALALGGLLVALVFFEVGWRGHPTFTPRFALGGFLAAFPSNLPWLAPFVAVAAVQPVLRALVWREVLPPPPPRFADTYHATALGVLVHNGVPGKLGPLAAAWVLARTSAPPFAVAFSSQLVAKLLELGFIVALGAAAAALRGSGAAIGRVVVAGAALFAVLASAAAVLALAAPRASTALARRLPRAGAALAALGAGILGAGSFRRLAAALAVAALPAVAAAAAYAFPLRALGVPEPATAGALLVSVIAFGQLTPGLPIGAGVYWSLASWAARELGAGAQEAAALAILTHAGTVGTNLLVGAVSALVRRSQVAELFRRRREVESLGVPAGGETAPRTRAPT